MLFSILINQVGMQLLIALLPLQLAGSTNPFDFVLNAVAAYFVIEMDDIDTKAYNRIDRANDEGTNGGEVEPIRSGADTTAGTHTLFIDSLIAHTFKSPADIINSMLDNF